MLKSLLNFSFKSISKICKIITMKYLKPSYTPVLCCAVILVLMVDILQHRSSRKPVDEVQEMHSYFDTLNYTKMYNRQIIIGKKGKVKIASMNITYKMPMKIDIAERHEWPVSDKEIEERILQKCTKKTYDISSLPSASIIIVFHQNEKLVHLLHTLHSIAKSSPKELLKEIIMVSDNSNKVDHQEVLLNYAQAVFPGLVKIYRSHKSLGLIRGRQVGVDIATGDVVISMDAHMEMQEKWLEPILEEIKKDRKTMVTPMLNWMKPISDDKKEKGKETGTRWVYEHGSSRFKTVWFWNGMAFTFMEIAAELVDSIEPILSPCSVGTIWAMDRKFFHEVGGFDEGMQFWGAENLDLPMRVFMFGGKHVNLPCSHAAHLEEPGQRDYRAGKHELIQKNYVRLVKTWFTPEYKKVIDYYNPQWRNIDPGDISNRLKIKERAIHNFTWYMENAYPEMRAPWINSFSWGSLKNIGLLKSNSSNYCAYVDFSDWIFKMGSCNPNKPDSHSIFWTTEGEIRLPLHIINPRKFEIWKLTIGNTVDMYGTNRIFKYMHYENGLIKVYKTDFMDTKCLGVVKEKPAIITLLMCDAEDHYQRWQFSEYTKEYNNLASHLEMPKTKPKDDKYYKELKDFVKMTGILEKMNP